MTQIVSRTERRLELLVFRPDIQGLRGISVLAVVIFHLGVGLPGGFVGVDVFFVISGFLMTGLIAEEFDSARDPVFRAVLQS